MATHGRQLSGKQLMRQIRTEEAKQNKVINVLPDVMFGEQSPEFRLEKLRIAGREALGPVISELQKLIDQATELRKKREAILQHHTAEWERELIKQGKLERGKHIRVSAEDRHTMLLKSNYFAELDTYFGQMANLSGPQRMLKNFSATFEPELLETGYELGRNKMQTLITNQHQPALDMNFADLEAIVTGPVEKRRAKRAIALQEGAANGEPVSAERKAKLLPKPKAKTRVLKRNKQAEDGTAAATAQAPKRVRKAQPVPAPPVSEPVPVSTEVPDETGGNVEADEEEFSMF